MLPPRAFIHFAVHSHGTPSSDPCIFSLPFRRRPSNHVALGCLGSKPSVPPPAGPGPAVGTYRRTSIAGGVVCRSGW